MNPVDKINNASYIQLSHMSMCHVWSHNVRERSTEEGTFRFACIVHLPIKIYINARDSPLKYASAYFE